MLILSWNDLETRVAVWSNCSAREAGRFNEIYRLRL
tara:strand:+ start:1730 stop:1837 length:108 start_codon:yes stop_codon:yes gene_type:complete